MRGGKRGIFSRAWILWERGVSADMEMGPLPPPPPPPPPPPLPPPPLPPSFSPVVHKGNEGGEERKRKKEKNLLPTPSSYFFPCVHFWLGLSWVGRVVVEAGLKYALSKSLWERVRVCHDLPPLKKEFAENSRHKMGGGTGRRKTAECAINVKSFLVHRV